MSSLERILCAIDFSPASLQALDVATQWCRKLARPLTVLHVVDVRRGRVAADRFPFAAPASVPEPDAMVADASARLETLASERLGDLPHAVEVIGHDDVAAGICERAETSDLVVIATRSKAGMERVLMGSVAERTLRHASCPVLVVRGEVSPDGAVGHNLVCTDLSDGAMPALRLGHDVSRAFGAATTLLFARAEDDAILSLPEPIEADVYEELRRLHATHLPAPVRTAYAKGASVAEAIMTHASQESCDLIVVASRAGQGLSRWLIRSVAEQVGRYAPCSVLVARAET